MDDDNNPLEWDVRGTWSGAFKLLAVVTVVCGVVFLFAICT